MKLSVIMSVYNGERYLASAIDSIIAQTFREFEFLIVDDGSTDGTAQLLSAYAQKDSRIKVVTHRENLGLTASLNELLQEVQGEYLARMDADDISLPERFARQVAWLDSHPECGVLGTSYWLINPAGHRRLVCRFENDHDFLCWYLCFQNPLAHPSVMGRTALFRSVGGYRSAYRYGQDFDLWWRLSRVARLGCLPEPLLELRQHPSCVSLTHKQDQMQAKRNILLEMLPGLGVARAGEVLSEHSDPQRVALRAELIRRAYAVFAQRPEVSERVRGVIQQDAAARLGLIWLRHPFSPGATTILAASLQYDLWVLLRSVWVLIKRYLVRDVDSPILRML